jgi:hypothetical protein
VSIAEGLAPVGQVVRRGRVTLERGDQWSVAVFGTWMVTGLFLDGWSHGVNKPETFFSPWHGLLYSGFAAAVVYGAVRTYRERSRGRSMQMDPLMALGLVLFGTAGVGDMIWHQIFGIEADLAALLSPSHLLLMTGGLLMASGPLRAAWTDDDASPSSTLRSFLPTVASMTLVVALVSFFTMYQSAFTQIQPTTDERMLTHAVTSVLATNLVLVAPLVLLLRRFSTPFGTFTILFGAVAFAMAGLESFDQVLLVVPALLGGVVADVLSSRMRLVATAAIVPAVMWTGFFAVLNGAYHVHMEVELWTGAIFLAVLAGIGFAVFADYASTGRNRAAVS